MTRFSSTLTTPPVSLEHIYTLWGQLAHRYFDGRLPPIAIIWSARLTASAGMFVSRVGPRSRLVPRVIRQGAGRIIRLSAPLLRDQPFEEVVRTVAHEMIHQWQFDIRRCRPDHGPAFQDKMQQMNRDGLGVSVYHQLHEVVQEWNRYAWQCVRCGYRYERQRRTIRISKHVCGQCGGPLQESELATAEQPISGPQEEDGVRWPQEKRGTCRQLLLPFEGVQERVGWDGLIRRLRSEGAGK